MLMSWLCRWPISVEPEVFSRYLTTTEGWVSRACQLIWNIKEGLQGWVSQRPTFDRGLMCSDTANPENGELIVIVQVPTKILLPAKEQKKKEKKRRHFTKSFDLDNSLWIRNNRLLYLVVSLDLLCDAFKIKSVGSSSFGGLRHNVYSYLLSTLIIKWDGVISYPRSVHLSMYVDLMKCSDLLV